MFIRYTFAFFWSIIFCAKGREKERDGKRTLEEYVARIRRFVYTSSVAAVVRAVITFGRVRFRLGWPPLGYHISGSSVRFLRSPFPPRRSLPLPPSSSHSRLCGAPIRARGITSISSTATTATAWYRHLQIRNNGRSRPRRGSVRLYCNSFPYT